MPRDDNPARRARKVTVGDALAHLERGGEEGGLAFFGNHSSDEVLSTDWKENS
jgi:hypothetical protein